MRSKITIQEIAQIAGVSSATVSRAFSHPDKVQEATRNRIAELCRQYDYRPKVYQKRHDPTDRDPFIAYVIPDLKNTFFTEIIDSIKKVLDTHGITLAIFDSQESAQCELQNLNFLEKMQVNGIFITPISETSQINSEVLKSFYKKGIPVILIDRDVKGVSLDGVFQNNYFGAWNAVSSLIKSGHQHIVTISGPISSNPGIDRLNGYLDALKEHQIPIRQEYILYGNNMKDSGYRLTRQILSRYPEVTAIFAANYLMAIGSLQAIHEAGLKVPRDISIISTGTLQSADLYGELQISELTSPTEAMGEECAKVMLERLSTPISARKKAPAKRVTFDIPLVLKGSEVCLHGKKNMQNTPKDDFHQSTSV